MDPEDYLKQNPLSADKVDQFETFLMYYFDELYSREKRAFIHYVRALAKQILDESQPGWKREYQYFEAREAEVIHIAMADPAVELRWIASRAVEDIPVPDEWSEPHYDWFSVMFEDKDCPVDYEVLCCYWSEYDYPLDVYEKAWQSAMPLPH